MIVKIGDKKFDSEKEPIMIELSLEERDLIANMDQAATKYCSYPLGMEANDVAKFMEIELGEELEEKTEDPDGKADDQAADGTAQGDVPKV